MWRRGALVDFEALRAEMVARQIEARGVTHARALAAMRAVPRHAFVPEDLRAAAYEDRPLPIGEGQTISQPYMVAAMTAALDPPAAGRVLEVGTGSGYQAAVLARLCREVVTIERHVRLAARAREVLAQLGLTNVRVEVGDGTLGFPQAQPYDGILVTAGAPAVPAPLRAQLADGGRLVVPVGGASYQELIVESRHGDRFTAEIRDACVFVPLVGRYGHTE
ncbi:MAG: protein-L-isoaspartate O-methyltransferase [Acidobacteria bacterium RIFCSPLOWO2_12_FULL_67_14b]|nr:MAG: protein-L-isoaspartate O-methyltransferase [Acidobacteria bacterium RIFCSPLOWO2_12_FULL_67_14b]